MTDAYKAKSLDELPWKDTEAAKNLRDKVESFIGTDGRKPFPYQQVGIAKFMAQRYCLNGDSMGVGKTCQALVAAHLLNLEKVLIICPKSVVKHWQDEAAAWTGRPLYSVTKSSETPENIDDKILWCVTPWSQISLRAARFQLKWDLVIIDELHFFKNPTRGRTIAAYGKWQKYRGEWKRTPGVIDKAERIWALSGTPVPNRPIEIQPTLRALEVPEAKNYDAFGKRFCYQKNPYTMRGYDYQGAQNLGQLYDILTRKIMIRRLLEDVADQLPDITRTTIEIEPPKGKEGADLRKQLELEHWAITPEQRNDIADAILSGKRLLGLPAFDEMSELRHDLARAKVPLVIEHVCELLDANEATNVVVWAHHRDVAEALKAGIHAKHPTKLLHGGLGMDQRQKAVSEFSAPDSTDRAFVATLGAAGTGVDGLQKRAHVAIFAEFDWVPGQLAQAEGRLQRLGQKNAVLVQYLVVAKSLDAYMLKTIQAKMRTQERILDGAGKISVANGDLDL